MALIYVTGPPGAGKSALKEEFSKHGYETHDMDDADLGGAHNIATNKPVEIPEAKVRSPDWYKEHEWRVYPDAIKDLKNQPRTKDIFVCGIAPDDIKILSLFDKIFYLDISEELLKQRITGRTDNDYGKNDFELKVILERKAMLDDRYNELKSTIWISADAPVSEIADKILTQLKLSALEKT
jgi:adenylate kinase family enzyme